MADADSMFSFLQKKRLLQVYWVTEKLFEISLSVKNHTALKTI